MSYRHTATWICGPFIVSSYGNGAAYQIEGFPNNGNVWLQGDDAAEFRDRYDAADRHSTTELDLRVQLIGEYAEIAACS